MSSLAQEPAGGADVPGRGTLWAKKELEHLRALLPSALLRLGQAAY
jgi:hypothetical protein